MGRIAGSRILVTGGTGSIGSEIVRQLMKRNPSHIILSRDDSKQFYLKDELSGGDIAFIIGDIRDRESTNLQRGVDMVVRSSAKHVKICELNHKSVKKTCWYSECCGSFYV